MGIRGEGEGREEGIRGEGVGLRENRLEGEGREYLRGF